MSAWQPIPAQVGSDIPTPHRRPFTPPFRTVPPLPPTTTIPLPPITTYYYYVFDNLASEARRQGG
eukprot:3403188-Prymnesium_polylepis.1